MVADPQPDRPSQLGVVVATLVLVITSLPLDWPNTAGALVAVAGSLILAGGDYLFYRSDQRKASA